MESAFVKRALSGYVCGTDKPVAIIFEHEIINKTVFSVVKKSLSCE